MALGKLPLAVVAIVFASFYLYSQLNSAINPFLRFRITLSSTIAILNYFGQINNINFLHERNENGTKRLGFAPQNETAFLKSHIVTLPVQSNSLKKIYPGLNSRRGSHGRYLEHGLQAGSKKGAEHSHSKERFLLTACTMVQNEAPYVVEWIEYNRIQGIDRIIIYDHDSTDNITLLNDLYQQHDPGFRVHVMKSLAKPASGRGLAQKNFQHCLDEYGNSTEWMMIADVDEYLHSPAFGTLASMLRNLSAIERRRSLHLSGVTSVNLNFGSSGQEHRFENRLARRADGRVAYCNPCGLQLITDHVRRGPARNIFGEEQEYQARARRERELPRRLCAAPPCCIGWQQAFARSPSIAHQILPSSRPSSSARRAPSPREQAGPAVRRLAASPQGLVQRVGAEVTFGRRERLPVRGRSN